MLLHSFLLTLQVSKLRLQVWMALDQNPRIRRIWTSNSEGAHLLYPSVRC